VSFVFNVTGYPSQAMKVFNVKLRYKVGGIASIEKSLKMTLKAENLKENI
jgi:hypothetical protein